MKNSDIYLSVPTRGSIRWETATRLEEIRDKYPGMPPIDYQTGHVCVALTRNFIINKFLETDAEVLVMVDDDVIPSPHFLEVVLPFKKGYGMVGLPYPMSNSQINLAFTIFEEQDDGYHPFWPMGGLNMCDAIGMGCVAISRAAVEAMGRSPFRVDYDPDAQVVGEDFLFCSDLRKKGFRIGYYFDGWFAEHCTVVGMAPIMELLMAQQLENSRMHALEVGRELINV